MIYGARWNRRGDMLVTLVIPNVGGYMRNAIICTLAGVLLASFTVGCSPGGNSSGTTFLSTQSSETIPTSTVAPQRPLPEGAIEYSRTGGFVGVDERWHFFTDGRVVDAQGVEYEISEIEISGLFDEIEALGFYDWEVEPERLGSCADCFTYTISAHYDGLSNQLTFVDAQAGVPEGIWVILDRIQDMVGSVAESQAD